jgi:hypothetical protein
VPPDLVPEAEALAVVDRPTSTSIERAPDATAPASRHGDGMRLPVAVRDARRR